MASTSDRRTFLRQASVAAAVPAAATLLALDLPGTANGPCPQPAPPTPCPTTRPCRPAPWVRR